MRESVLYTGIDSRKVGRTSVPAARACVQRLRMPSMSPYTLLGAPEAASPRFTRLIDGSGTAFPNTEFPTYRKWNDPRQLPCLQFGRPGIRGTYAISISRGRPQKGRSNWANLITWNDWGGGYDHVPLKVVNGVSSGSGYAASTLWLKPIRTRYLFSMKQCLAYARTATAGVLGDIKWALGEYDLTQASGLRVDGNSCECSQHTEEYNCKL